MKQNNSAGKSAVIAATLIGGVLGLAGCADYASVGVGYGGAYYVPDYRPYYATYIYDGVPWWGPNAYYFKKKVVVRDVDKHVNVNRNIYYGGHHLARDSRGGRTVARSAFRSGERRERR